MNIKQFTVEGVEQGEYIPEIISSKTSQDDNLLDVVFENNPVDTFQGQRLHVYAKPLKIVYDAQTINKVIDIFTVPPSSTLEQYVLD